MVGAVGIVVISTFFLLQLTIPTMTTSYFPIRHCSLLLLVVLCLPLLGCGPGIDEKGRHNIRGTVTYDGSPLTVGEITFSPLETKAPAGASRLGGVATIQSDGMYSLTRDSGLFEGTYQVGIRSFKLIHKGSKEDVVGINYDAAAVDMVYLIPRKYESNSGITITVSTDKNQTHNFDLEK